MLMRCSFTRRFVVAKDFGTTDHLLHLWDCSAVDELNFRMRVSKHPKNLVSKRLSNSLNAVEVQNHRLELINSLKEALGLRPRNQILVTDAR